MELLLQRGRGAKSEDRPEGLGPEGLRGSPSPPEGGQPEGSQPEGGQPEGSQLEGWALFDAELSSRGFYRGEIPISSLHARLRAHAAASFAAPISRPARTTWIASCAADAREWLLADGVRLIDLVGWLIGWLID